MAVDPASAPLYSAEQALALAPQVPDRVSGWRDFPYWLLAIFAVLGWMAYLIATQERFNHAYHAIVPGVRTTIEATLVAFVIALALGLVLGLGRISRNVVLKNLAQFYIEFIRGVPIIVLIFTIAFVVVPTLTDWFGIESRSVTSFMKGVAALAMVYAAYLAEVFRAGIESIPRGQIEAGRSLGMSHWQTMRRVILPQAVRNMLPAIGNDAISMLKDSSLISVLAVREITQEASLDAGITFEFKPTYLVLTFLYLSMTIVLSLLLTWYRRWLGLDSRA